MELTISQIIGIIVAAIAVGILLFILSGMLHASPPTAQGTIFPLLFPFCLLQKRAIRWNQKEL